MKTPKNLQHRVCFNVVMQSVCAFLNYNLINSLCLQITLPTGTKVTFNYGSTFVDGINIIPSVLDTDATQGLCGIYNGNTSDDFTPRGQLAAVKDVKTFASSWQYVLNSDSSKEFSYFDKQFYRYYFRYFH